MVPWKDVSSDNDTYIDTDCIPIDVVVREPLKLRLTEVVSLWEHWTARQRQGDMGLEFVQAKKGDMRENKQKGKKRANHEWMDLDDPDMQPQAGPSQSSPQMQPAPGPSGSHQPENFEPLASTAVPVSGQDEPHVDEDPHLESPADNRSSKKLRMSFLKTLSTHSDYQAMLKDMMKLKVSI